MAGGVVAPIQRDLPGAEQFQREPPAPVGALVPLWIEPVDDGLEFPGGKHLTPRRVVLVTFGAGALAIGALALYAGLAWRGVRALSRERPATTAFIERFQAQQRAEGAPDHVEWTWVPDDSISPHLKIAVLAAEDVGFFAHPGFELGEMRLALTDALRARAAPRGASTITQQLAKNLWLSGSRDPIRKLKEAILTWQIESALSKRRILEVYLNVVEFGRGMYGAEAAAQRYFGKHAASLSEHEAALLAASLPRPRTWNPRSKSQSYQRQVLRIEALMGHAGFLWSHIGSRPMEPTTAAADTSLANFLRAADTLFRSDRFPPDSVEATEPP